MCPILKIFFLPIFVLVHASGAAGQLRDSDTFPGPEEFGRIPDSLFASGVDHDYPFEYLLKKKEIRFTESGGRVQAVLEHHSRLKIYTGDPVLIAEAALTGIPFYFDQDMEEVVHIEGITHLPDGSRIRLDPEEVRTADLNSRYRIHEFIMPGAQQGAVLEYRYTTNRRYIDELPDFYFSHTVPVVLAHLTLHNQDYLRYDATGFNLDFDVHYHEQKIDTSRIPLVFTYSRPEPVSVEHWYARDIPAVDETVYISSVNDLRGQMKFQISEFGRPRQPLENSWELVVAQILRGENNPFILTGQMETFRETGRKLAREASSGSNVRDAIFQHVNEKMTFNGIRRAFPETPVDSVAKGAPSDQAAINLVLLAMLEGAGEQAWPVYLSGRTFGRLRLSFPSVYQFNQMLVAVRDGDGISIMDAGFPHSRPGLISVDSYHDTGLKLKKDGFEWIDIRPAESMFDLDVEVKAELSAAGDLAGTLKVVTEGYPAREIREELSVQRSPAAVIREAFFDSHAEVEIADAEIRLQKPGGYALVLTAGFRIPGYAVSFREGLQFRPMLTGTLQRNPFPGAERSVPVILDAPEKLNVRYDITLPDGYSVEEMQQGLSTSMRGAELREVYEISGRHLKYEFTVNIARTRFQGGEYRELRRFYDRWVILSNEEWYIERRSYR